MKKSLKIPEQHVNTFTQKAVELSLVKEKIDLSPEDTEIYKEAYTLSQTNPKKALPIAKRLYQRAPDCEEVLNLLTYLFYRLRKTQKADRLVRKHYKLYPNSLLARIHFAELQLRKRRKKAIPKIFCDCYDLQELLPNRKQFHINEYVAFMNVMGRYHLAIKNKEHASYYHLLAHKLQPNHPSTRQLGHQLYKTSLKQKLYDIFGSWNKTSSSVKTTSSVSSTPKA